MGAIAKTIKEQLQNLVTTITTSLSDLANTRERTLEEIERLNVVLQDNVADTVETLAVLDEFGNAILDVAKHHANQFKIVEEKTDYLAELPLIGKDFCEECGEECDDSITFDGFTFCSEECRDKFVSAVEEKDAEVTE